ncbi:amiloride-sensitive sodium channel subunit alpha [Nephila pilipes]|uniref:Amiloride-sensitive sodium channel subunit alpha n=1 Tax=Nephila pilipes TaxID=299642 RepID=A0A8X6QRI8_NEPPI|nr:amiloride-sensitive sodium channel subunit alpha [Nephila pilipes]
MLVRRRTIIKVMKMDSERIEHGSENRKKSLKSYTSMVLQESSLSALSNIISTKHPFRKAFKIFVLICCFTGFFYQCYTFLSHIFQYPTIVDIDIKNPIEIELPALTFCDNNGISRKRFCTKLPHCCMEADEDLCLKYPSYCDMNETTMVPRPEYYSIINKFSTEELSDIGRSIGEMLINQESSYNVLNSIKPEGPFIRAKTIFGTGRMPCYSLFSIVNSPEKSRMQGLSPILERPAVTLTFDVNDEDEFVPGHKNGVFLSVHSPYMGNNPSEKGIFMETGKTYKIYVTTDKEMLLPYPYETDCVNYTELWENNNRTGPRIQEMCLHKCLLDAASKSYNCSPVFVLYPNDLRICDFSELDGEFMKYYIPCAEKCKDDCSKTKYTLDVQERFTSDYIWDEIPDEDHKKLIKVEIIIEKAEVITFLHRPQYLDVEVFSYIGGFIGVWLGISLIQIADLGESMFRIMCYAFKK